MHSCPTLVRGILFEGLGTHCLVKQKKGIPKWYNIYCTYQSYHYLSGWWCKTWAKGMQSSRQKEGSQVFFLMKEWHLIMSSSFLLGLKWAMPSVLALYVLFSEKCHNAMETAEAPFAQSQNIISLKQRNSTHITFTSPSPSTHFTSLPLSSYLSRSTLAWLLLRSLAYIGYIPCFLQILLICSFKLPGFKLISLFSHIPSPSQVRFTQGTCQEAGLPSLFILPLKSSLRKITTRYQTCRLLKSVLPARI